MNTEEEVVVESAEVVADDTVEETPADDAVVEEETADEVEEETPADGSVVEEDAE